MDTSISVLLERAIQAMRSAQWQPAQQTLREVPRQSPDEPAALQLLGVAAFEEGRADRIELLVEHDDSGFRFDWRPAAL